MPVLLQNGSMAIVAHTDDDLLFMNPDIANSISNGEVATTVFVTAGDAGREDWYWQGRETGIKAAYAVMAGTDDWVDETVSIVQNDTQFDVVSSYLSSAPEVRLYFLRIPDGAGEIADPNEYETLARLEEGTLTSADSVDGQASYTRDDLVNVLTGLMEAHQPSAFRLQVSDGDASFGEHTDHIHATEFALEAFDAFEAENDYRVYHYVNYQSRTLEPNLSPEEAAFSLEVMQAYAAHDSGVTDEYGNLLPVFEDWSMRQYVDESYLASEVEQDEQDDEPTVLSNFTLGDHPDNFYFEIDSATGEITTKHWFSPSLLDAWDADADYIYEVTRIETPLDGSPPTTEIIQFDTVAEGVLGVLEDADADTDENPLDDDPTGDDPIEDDPVDDEPDEEDIDDPALDDPQPAQSEFSLGDHPDNFYFNIDAQTGEITPKDWFSPSLLDAWDANEDYIYEVTRIETPLDGGAPMSELIRFDTEAEGALSVLDEDGPSDEPIEEDDPDLDDPVDDSVDPIDDETPPDPPSSVVYQLSGPDSFLFEINAVDGVIATKDWFVPQFRDAWDQDENNIYELTRTGTNDDGSIASRQFITYEVTRGDVLSLTSVDDDILLSLATGNSESDDSDLIEIVEEEFELHHAGV